MAKPHWVDAPEWAQWLAQDSDGQWFWHEFEPAPLFVVIHGQPSFWTAGGGSYDWARTTPVKGDWTSTLEARP